MIYLGADHRGFLQKEKIKEYLRSLNLDVTDLGPDKVIAEDDFPLISVKVAETVAHKNGDLGILICGSGAGACLSANKVVGARAALGFSVKQIHAAREEDNINILCLAGDHLDPETNLEIVESFINTVYVAEERRVRRLLQISDYESKTR
jgi:ribose 5-phosphate isomerase B